MSDIYLKYVGGAFLPGVPARDLTREEADSHGVAWLLTSGLYVRVSQPVEKPKPASDKSLRGGYENKDKE